MNKLDESDCSSIFRSSSHFKDNIVIDSDNNDKKVEYSYNKKIIKQNFSVLNGDYLNKKQNLKKTLNNNLKNNIKKIDYSEFVPSIKFNKSKYEIKNKRICENSLVKNNDNKKLSNNNNKKKSKIMKPLLLSDLIIKKNLQNK